MLQACQKDDQFNAESNQSPSRRPESQLIRPDLLQPDPPDRKRCSPRRGYKNNNGEPVAVGVNLSTKGARNLPSEPAMYTSSVPQKQGRNFYTDGRAGSESSRT